jgi:hypothetical protein
VIYIEQERESDLTEKAGLLSAHHGCDLTSMHVMPVNGFALHEARWHERLESAVDEIKPVLVVINSFPAVYRGHPANSIDVNEALGWLGTLAERSGAAIIMVDGANKPGALGNVHGMASLPDSAQKGFVVDTVLSLERKRDKHGLAHGPTTVHVSKARSGIAGPGFRFDVLSTGSKPDAACLQYLGEWVTDADDGTAPQVYSARDLVLAALPSSEEAGVTIADLVAQTVRGDGTLSTGTVRNALTNLKRGGLAEQARYGHWRKVSSVSPPVDDSESDSDTP